MKTSTPSRWLLHLNSSLALLLSYGATCHVFGAITLVSPAPATYVEGNTHSGTPFSLGAFTGLATQRCQEIYGATDFSAITTPMLLTQIAFRPDAGYGSAFSSILPDLQIDLSTTMASPDALSVNFAENVGSDPQMVFSGALVLSSQFTGPTTGPKDFDIVIPLTTPFLYDPKLGNLLLEIRNRSDVTTTFFDAQFGSDSVSRLASLSLDGVNDESSPRGRDSVGLVTQFQFEPVQVVPDLLPVWITPMALLGILFLARQATLE